MKLSIIILNYNTTDLTLKCIDSIIKNTKNLSYEIIVVDNGSEENIQINKYPNKQIKLIKNETNLGFAGGNNSARDIAKGEYILFLNSDTEVYKNTLEESVSCMDEHQEIGALTCKTILPSGKNDKDSRRSFPTPWVAFTHFSGLDRIFPKSKIFAKYWYGYKSPDEIHEIDALQGAFFLTRKKILDEVGWFSEEYFLDGEDIDLSWKIKNVGYENVYYPKVSILHIKKASKKTSQRRRFAGRRAKLRSVMAGMNSMEIFYEKHLWEKYPLFLNLIVIGAIYCMKAIRFGKVVLHL